MQVNAGQNLSLLDRLAVGQGQQQPTPPSLGVAPLGVTSGLPQQVGLPQQTGGLQGFTLPPQQGAAGLNAVDQFRLMNLQTGDPNAIAAFGNGTGPSALQQISESNSIGNLLNLSQFASGNLQGINGVTFSGDGLLSQALGAAAAVNNDPLIQMVKGQAGLGRGLTVAQQTQMSITGALGGLTNPTAGLSNFALGGNQALGGQIQQEIQLTQQARQLGISVAQLRQLLGIPTAGQAALQQQQQQQQLAGALPQLLAALGGGGAPAAGGANPLAALGPLLASLGGAGAAAPAAPQIAASRQIQANAPQANVTAAPQDPGMALLMLFVSMLAMQGQGK
jgi:hypothetical protein